MKRLGKCPAGLNAGRVRPLPGECSTFGHAYLAGMETWLFFVNSHPSIRILSNSGPKTFTASDGLYSTRKSL